MLVALSLICGSNGETYSSTARKFVETILDATLPSSDLPTADKTALSTLLVNNCSIKTSYLSDALEDATNISKKCKTAFTDKTNDKLLSEHDRYRLKNCSSLSRGFFEKYKGGADIFLVPHDTGFQAHVRQCAEGDEDSYKVAIGHILNRYTPCSLNITANHLRIFHTIIDPPSTASDEERREADARVGALRTICISLSAFEDLRSNVVDFVSNAADTFINQALDMAEMIT